MRRLLLVATTLATLAVAAPAGAATPILPLSDVQPGMQCTGLTVVQGTTISSFDVEIVDVVEGDPVSAQPLLLIRVSGPAVADSGIAEGFSGSPVLCDGKLVGAVSYGSGDYGNMVGFATPIQEMLGEPVPTPPGLHVSPELAHAHPLKTPISVTGVSAPVFAPFSKAASKAGMDLVAVPAAPVGDRFPVQTMQPGASVAVGLSSGAISSGAVGTVTDVDGDKVYAFGHPFDGTGQRSLLLQDAYVYTVIDNPLDTADSVSSKLAAPGHDIGTLTYDGSDGVTGLVGTLPPTIALTQRTQDGATGKTRVDRAKVADESQIGLPSGSSPIDLVAPMLTAQAAYTTLDGSPVAQTASMCVRLHIRQLRKPAGFCNRYVGDFGGTSDDNNGGPFVDDLASALADVDAFSYATPDLTSVDVHLTVAPGLSQALLRSVSGPKVVHRGQTVALKLHLQRYRGARITRTAHLRVPRSAPLGSHAVRLTGTGLDGSSGGDDLQIVLGGGGGNADGGDSSPKSLAGLADEIAATHVYDGVRARIGKAHARPLYRDPSDRISGHARLTLNVVR